MNIISVPMLGITVTESSGAATVVSFVEAMIK